MSTARIGRWREPAGRGRAVTRVVLALAVGAAVLSLVVVALRGPARPRTMQERVQAIASTLRCPACQDLSVAESPSGLARQMRAIIERDLEAGKTPEEIRARFVRAYGEWILLAPEREGITLLAWALPLVLLVAGLLAVALLLRRWSARARHGDRGDGTDETPGLSAADRRLLYEALAHPSEEPD